MFSWRAGEELQGGCNTSMSTEGATPPSRLTCRSVLAMRTDRRRLGSGSSWPRWYLFRETENTNCRWLSQKGLVLSETSTSSGGSLRFCPFMIIFKLWRKAQTINLTCLGLRENIYCWHFVDDEFPSFVFIQAKKGFVVFFSKAHTTEEEWTNVNMLMWLNN